MQSKGEKQWIKKLQMNGKTEKKIQCTLLPLGCHWNFRIKKDIN